MKIVISGDVNITLGECVDINAVIKDIELVRDSELVIEGNVIMEIGETSDINILVGNDND